MHFSGSSTATGIWDLQPPAAEVLAGPTGLTEHEETGGRGTVFREREILRKGQVAEADCFSLSHFTTNYTK